MTATVTPIGRTTLTLLPAPQGPNLLKVLIAERHWTFAAFRRGFEKAAEQLGNETGEIHPRTLTVSQGSMRRWTSGRLLPLPDTCRVLEALFGYPIEQLFAPASARPATADVDQAERAPVVPVAPWLDVAALVADPATAQAAARLAELFTAAFLAGVQYAATAATSRAGVAS